MKMADLSAAIESQTTVITAKCADGPPSFNIAPPFSSRRHERKRETTTTDMPLTIYDSKPLKA
jgi:hypothetical protein